MPGEGSSGVARLLRLAGGALDAPADDERDRERVRDGAAADGKDQGVGNAGGMPDDGVQADAIGVAKLAGAQRLGAAERGHQGNRIRRWAQERGRRLIKSSSTTIDNTPAFGAVASTRISLILDRIRGLGAKQHLSLREIKQLRTVGVELRR